MLVGLVLVQLDWHRNGTELGNLLEYVLPNRNSFGGTVPSNYDNIWWDCTDI